MIRAFAIAVLLLFGSQAVAQSVSFPSVPVGTSQAGPEMSGWVSKPPGDGPFPAIILAHSCAGVGRHTDAWAKLLVNWGYLVLAPDSFNPRGTKAVCTTPNVVTPNMRVADIAGALDYLATRPDVVKGKVGIIGHSHGGSTVIRSAQSSFALDKRGLVAGVAYYPGCNPQFDTAIDIPVLLLAGDKDDWTSSDRCRKLVGSLARGDLVEAIYYPEAYHSFDVKAADRTVPGAAGKQHRLVYDTVAAPDAEARTRAFFAKYLR
ncbi:dienelactone hydrolase family protein [Reyranella sp.]|uniref:dienelactone hydrolase family protein n=1 Tax=Reyranella sp. TaxID=1929291 RepID=UPI0025E4D25C|nr:dienelactone hydrolase family protein [Reyranella sp.]